MATTMGSRKKKNKRNQKKRSRPRQTSHAPPAFLEGATVLVEPAGQAKMSEVLLEFLQPYSEHWWPKERMEKLLAVALIAWNAAIHTGRERHDFIEDMVKAVPPEVREAMRSIVDEMVRRKETYFASNKRLILSYDLTLTPAGPHLSVVSTLPVA
jgi:hypothetical protein